MKRGMILATVLLALYGTALAWEPSWTTLDAPGANGGTYARDIDGGKIVGYYTSGTYGGPGFTHGFLFDGSDWTILDKPGISHTYVMGIDGNKIVGYFWEIGYGNRGFLYDGSSWTTLDAPGGYNTQVNGISGDNIVGTDANSTGTHGFLFDGTDWTTLDAPSANDKSGTNPYGIDGNNIVGYYNRSPGYPYTFRLNGTTWTTMTVTGVEDSDFSKNSWLQGIDGNRLVGGYWDTDTVGRGLFYDGSIWTAINAPGSTGTDAFGIDGNQIVGQYRDVSGMYHGFVAIVPEPSSLLALASSVIGLAGLRLRKRRA